MATRQARMTAIGVYKLLALVVLAGLIGAPLVRADPITNFYTTGAGQGADAGAGVGQGEFPSACVNGLADGYNSCTGTKRLMPGTIFTIVWMQHAPSLSVAGQAEGRERMHLAQRATLRR